MNITETLRLMGIVPVVKLDRAEDAVPLARALLKGGLPCAEITFRTAAAEESIRRIKAEVPELLVGAGTVLTVDQAKKAISAGAAFIVTPGFNIKTSSYCIEQNVPVFPGCNNPSAIEAALELGLTNLKFFPAEQSGGLPMIKALSAPYPQVHFMPTGGVNEDNLLEYLSYPQIMACGGSWMVKESLIQEQRFDEVERLCARAVERMLNIRLAHVGVYCDSAQECSAEAGKMAELIGARVKDVGASMFVGSVLEYFKAPFIGDKGHIALGVENVDRAFYHLSRKGYAFIPETIRYNEAGQMLSAYFKEETAGFVVHLCANSANK